MGRLAPLACSLFVTCLVLTGSAVAAAQDVNQFRGLVVDERTGQPVADATVSIAGLTGSAKTDAEGHFTWEPLPSPPFVIIVVLSGGQVARPVVVEALTEVVEVRVNPVADETITVLGAAPSIDTTPAAGTAMLSATQIQRRNPGHLMQALETVPGISQVSEGHAAVPAVRGMARGRTLLLIDGARVSSERRVGPSATFLDPSTIEGIDVARGPGSVAYGSDALGGVISVRTRRAEPGSPLRARFTGTLGAGVPDRFGSLEVSKGVAQGGVLVQARVRSSGDYEGPDEAVFNSGWEDTGFLVNANHAAGPGVVSASWQSDFGRDVERPRNNSRTVRFYYPYEDSHRLTGGYVVPEIAGLRQLSITGFLGTYDQRTDQDRYPTPTTGRSIERADVTANDFHVKGSAQRLFGHARVEFGVDVNGRYGLEADDILIAYDTSGALTREVTNASIENAHRFDTGGFLEAETTVGGVARFSGGGRVDRVTTENEGGYFGDRSSDHTAFSGFGAVTVGPFEGVSVTTQVSRGFRDPVLSDRYFRGPSGRGFITGNPDLDPETSLQFDLAVRYVVGRTQLAAYGYHYRIDDLIERYQTEPDFFFFRNRGRARLRGVEVESRSELGRGYSLELGVQFSRGEALDDDAPLDDVSPATFSVVGRKEIGERGYGQVRLALAGEDDRPGPSEVVAPGSTVLDIGGGWRLHPSVELRGQVRNLLNDEYYASPDPRWVYAPGRSASITTVLQF